MKDDIRDRIVTINEATFAATPRRRFEIVGAPVETGRARASTLQTGWQQGGLLLATRYCLLPRVAVQ